MQQRDDLSAGQPSQRVPKRTGDGERTDSAFTRREALRASGYAGIAGWLAALGWDRAVERALACGEEVAPTLTAERRATYRALVATAFSYDGSPSDRVLNDAVERFEEVRASGTIAQRVFYDGMLDELEYGPATRFTRQSPQSRAELLREWSPRHIDGPQRPATGPSSDAEIAAKAIWKATHKSGWQTPSLDLGGDDSASKPPKSGRLPVVPALSTNESRRQLVFHLRAAASLPFLPDTETFGVMYDAQIA